MLHPISRQFPKLYTLKDIHSLEEVKPLYADYGHLYADLGKLGYELAYIDDSSKQYFVKSDELAIKKSLDSSERKKSTSQESKVLRDYGLKVGR